MSQALEMAQQRVALAQVEEAQDVTYTEVKQTKELANAK
jgi:hypothetical protein